MIQFKREDSMSINLLFDKEGLAQLLESLKNALKGEHSYIVAQFDASILSFKKGTTENTSIQIEYTGSNETQLYKQNNQIIWRLDKEDTEVAIDRLELCETEGYFSPAEFIRVQVPKNKRLDYIYCELKTKLD